MVDDFMKIDEFFKEYNIEIKSKSLWIKFWSVFIFKNQKVKEIVCQKNKRQYIIIKRRF